MSDNLSVQMNKLLGGFRGMLSFPGGASGKEPACQPRRHKRRRFDPWVGKIPWRRAWQPTPIFLPGEFRGQRSLAGYSPQVYKKQDATECTRVAGLSPDLLSQQL